MSLLYDAIIHVHVIIKIAHAGLNGLCYFYVTIVSYLRVTMTA